MDQVSLVLIVAVVTCLWLLIRRPPHPADQLPGPPTVPFFGNVLLFMTSKENNLLLMNEHAKLYYPFYTTWAMKYLPIIHPLDPKYVETILASSEHIYKSPGYKIMQDWLGDGLLISAGAKWHSRRKLLTPAFHFSILEQFMPVFCDKTNILVEKLRDAANSNPDGFDIVPYITRCALDIICETAMGTAVNAQEKNSSTYVSNVYEIADLFIYRVRRPWFWPRWIFNLTPIGRRYEKCLKELHDFTDKVIRDRREEIKRSKLEYEEVKKTDDDTGIKTKKKFAFLDLLLTVSEKDVTLNDEEIRAEVDTFMFEGHDTTAMGMSWTLYFLSVHQDVQARCVEELEEIFSGSDRNPNLTDLGNMKYLERVIKESLRIRPSVRSIGRELLKNLKFDGYDEFPAKTMIQVDIYHVHRNPEIYPDPEKFDPDRFLPENSVGRHPYAYIPFSAGPRNCIGQKFAMLELKEVISTVLRHFRLESCDLDFYLAAHSDIVLRPVNGLRTRFYPRKMN